MRITLVVGLFMALSGCGETAVLHVELGLPVASDSKVFALAEVKRGTGPFDWAADQGASQPLSSAGPSSVSFDVFAEDDHIDDPFRLRVRLCEQEGCTGENDGIDKAPRHEILFTRALFAQQETRWMGTPASAPIDPSGQGTHDPLVVDKCEVAGCRGGSPLFWCRKDGTHFCE
ncbi:MAG: hypothetical protein KC416_01750 [Myxococcales bacterium]|nr:hypothetical protein [Myxococcales bacterium]